MTQYEGNRDTTGVTGNPGPVPLGTAHISKPKDTTSDGDGSARFGGGPYAQPAPAGSPDTTQTDGAGVFKEPMFTGYTSTLDTLNGIANVTQQYRAPSSYVPAGNVDTTGTDKTGVGYDVNKVGALQWVYMTQETYTIGAGAPGQAGSQMVALTDAGVSLTQKDIFRNTIVVRTEEGSTEEVQEEFQISPFSTELYYNGVIDGSFTLAKVGEATFTGDEDVVLTETTPVLLAQERIISAPGDMVVTYDGSPLTPTTDYVITESDGTYSIVWVDGGALPTGTETVNVSYEYQADVTPLVEGTDYTLGYKGIEEHRKFVVTLDEDSSIVDEGDLVRATYDTGTVSYFRPVYLAENIDYTVERSGAVGDVTTTIKRVPTSESFLSGSDVTVEYLYGSLQFFNSRLPEDVPDAPTGVVAYRGNHYVDVQWLPPATGAEVDGYLIQSSTDGLVYVGASETRALVQFLEADRHNNEHDSGDPNISPDGKFGTYNDYKFRVAALNALGRGPYSDWTTPSTSPLNYDSVAPNMIPLENRINPIYRADGTVVPGTGLGKV